jgi:hypothetical protein
MMEASSSTSNDDDRPFENYQHCVSYSIELLRNLEPIVNVFTQEDLLCSETNHPKRIRIVKNQWKYFEIFPWILQFIKLQNPTSLVETMEDPEVDQMVEAINYFWNRRVDESELMILEDIFLQFGGDDAVKNPLSRILEVYRYVAAGGFGSLHIGSGDGQDDCAPSSSPMTSPSSKVVTLNDDEDKAFEDYQYCVSYSFDLLRKLEPIGNLLTQVGLMTSEKNYPMRIRIRKNKWKYLEIFPWVLQVLKLQKPASLRETMEGEDIDHLIDALNDFWNHKLDESQLQLLKPSFLQSEGVTKKVLSRVVDVHRSLKRSLTLSLSALTSEESDDQESISREVNVKKRPFDSLDPVNGSG